MNVINKLTPAKIVEELDKYIIGQEKAKRSVAIALRNRWRRQKVRGELQNEIMPNNIILIGPTGVGKTEIARRLAKLANAPFTKVEASKFTEVGYVGRDVESMIRELLDVAINHNRDEMIKKVAGKARENAFEKVLEILLPAPKNQDENSDEAAQYQRTRKKMEKMLKEGKLKDRIVEVSAQEQKSPQFEIFSNVGMETIDFNISDMLGNIVPFSKKSIKKKMTTDEAIKYYTDTEANKMVNKEKVIEEAKRQVEESGIIFIDEIDKIASKEKGNGPDVSRSGVQRDLLPILEGSNVPTKHGIIDTSHILFIAAGAFHQTKPADLIPELQGRFPIREELNSLTKEDFEKILILPRNALIKQYISMFATEDVNLTFESEAISRIAYYAALANERMEDIGARRLHTVMNTLLEEYLFRMPDKDIEFLNVTAEMVNEKLDRIIEDQDLSKYIL